MLLTGAVERREELDGPRPVLGGESRLESCDVPEVHVHEAPLLEGRGPAGGVGEAGGAREDAAVEVQVEPVGEYRDLPQIEPRAVADAECEAQPVGDVDHVLVLDAAPRDLGAQPIETAGDIRPGVVDVVRGGLRGGAPGREVAVAQGAQRLPQPLVLGVEAFVVQLPGGHA